MAFTPRLDAFRFYNDDGSESAATAIAAQNANVTFPDGSGNKNYHLRLGVQETGAQNGSNNPWKLQYSKNGGAYADVNLASSNVKGFDSANLTDGGTTTQRLTGLTGTFVPGLICEDGTTGNTAITASNNKEFLFAIQVVDTDLTGGDTLDFRILYGAAVLSGGYAQTPRIVASLPLTVAGDNSASLAGAVTLTPKTALTLQSAVSLVQTDTPAIVARGPLPTANANSASTTDGAVQFLNFIDDSYTVGTIVYGSLSDMPGYSYSRTGAKAELDASGTPTAFGVNVPATISGFGYYSRPATVCGILWNRDLTNAAWTKRGTGAVTTDGTLNVDGSANASKLTGINAVGNDVYQIAGGAYRSLFIKKITSTGVLRITSPSDGTSSWDVDFSKLGAGWTRITAVHPSVTVVNAISAGGCHFIATSGGPLSFYVDYVQQMDVAQGDGGPLIATTTTAVTIGADVLGVNVPNGTYTATYVFDNGSFQNISTVVSGGVFAMPTYPTLNKPLVKYVTLGTLVLAAPFAHPAVSATQTRGNSIGSELVKNGDFTGSIANWVPVTATLSNPGGAILRVTNNGATGTTSQAIPTDIGQTYNFSADFLGAPNTAYLRVGTGAPMAGDYFDGSGAPVSAPTSFSFSFVATTNTAYITLANNNSGVGVYSEWDNVSLKETALSLLPKTALTVANDNSASQVSTAPVALRYALTAANTNSASQTTSLGTLVVKYALLVSSAISTTLASSPTVLGHVLVLIKAPIDPLTADNLAVNPGTIIFKGDLYTMAFV